MLVRQLDAIIAKHAGEPGRHRAFVHDFIRAVHHATGQLYSAASYRKLLQAYAPGRTPATATIESEKHLLVAELKRRSPAPASAVEGPWLAPPGPTRDAGQDLALQQIVTLQHHVITLVKQLAQAPAAPDLASGLRAHNGYLRERLASTETALAAAQTAAAAMAAQCQEMAGLAAERARQVDALQGMLATHTAALSVLSTELTGAQRFMMMQVDGVRGETRAVRELCEQLKAQLKEKEAQVDMYRQMVLSRGAGAGGNGLR
ncbi:hypothetical protein [Pseudoduganella buxea]|uniref:Uncharacterized protein n=1 Tax=Pseudoduganella buxea TaxID=1949069 RepID=A0A6I3T016_9BURK|nr:hypothetical protein [Pseudoduganella buxea]MTV54921.1 hypothetical protein [Pseudoduganella buxea]GGC23821.1 hypothetical protein GCM10011572_51660 [Pseudoduganella buxea]